MNVNRYKLLGIIRIINKNVEKKKKRVFNIVYIFIKK